MPTFEGFEPEAAPTPNFAALGFVPDLPPPAPVKRKPVVGPMAGPQQPPPTAAQEALQPPEMEKDLESIPQRAVKAAGGGPLLQTAAGGLGKAIGNTADVAALAMGKPAGGGLIEDVTQAARGLSPEEMAGATDAEIVPSGLLEGPAPAPAPAPKPEASAPEPPKPASEPEAQKALPAPEPDVPSETSQPEAPIKAPLTLRGQVQPSQPKQGALFDTNNSPSSTLPPQSMEDFQPSDEPMPQLEADPYKRADVFEVPTKDIKVAPDVFQYKVEGIDPKTGAGASGRGAEAFDPEVQPIELWRDSKGEIGDPGSLYVSHGHHRYSIANRTDYPQMRAVILDSGEDYPGAVAHGVTKEDARARGAYQNFRDEKGTAVDAATYLRDKKGVTPQDMAKMGIDLKSAMMQQALAMRDLTEPVWYQASIGKLKPEIASIIGKNLDKPKDQVQAMKAFQQTEESGRPMSAAKFDYFVKLVKNAQTVKTEQDTLFGKEVMERSTYQEEADLLANAARQLSGEGTAFGTAAKKKTLLEKGQNVINAETSKALSQEAHDRLAVLNQYGTVPGTNTNMVLRKFAAHLAEKPSQRKAIMNEAYDALVKAIDEDNPGMQHAAEQDTQSGSLF